MEMILLQREKEVNKCKAQKEHLIPSIIIPSIVPESFFLIHSYVRNCM